MVTAIHLNLPQNVQRKSPGRRRLDSPLHQDVIAAARNLLLEQEDQEE